MSKYKIDDLKQYTIINGILVVKGGHWILLNDETKSKINSLLLEACNNPIQQRKRDEHGQLIK